MLGINHNSAGNNSVSLRGIQTSNIGPFYFQEKWNGPKETLWGMKYDIDILKD